jgi:hypothetical protein
MLITIIKIIFEIIKRRKEEINILILTNEEMKNIDISILNHEAKKEAKKEFDIYIGKDKIN